MTRNCLPVDKGQDTNPMRTIWIPSIIGDPVLFQATTSFAAVHLDILEGHQSRPRALAQKCETIDMVNRRLQSPEDAITDSTIGAVAMLAAMEVKATALRTLGKPLTSTMHRT